MKYILLLAICWSGCTKHSIVDFNVGDCVISTLYTESWEEPNKVEKIVRVGKKKYTIAYYTTAYNLNTVLTVDMYKSFYNNYKTVKCTKELENYVLQENL